MHKLTPLFAMPFVLLLVHCSDTQSVECPCGQQLNTDGADCVPIPCEGGDLTSCACVCPGGQTLVDGVCVALACIDLDCDDENECTSDGCDAEGQCFYEDETDGADCEDGGAAGKCMSGECNTDPCASMDCDDDNECTTDRCENADCINEHVADDRACDAAGSAGLCKSGACELDRCADVDCSENDCRVDDICNASNGECEGGSNIPSGDPCASDGGNVCDGNGACDECVVASTDCTPPGVCAETVCTAGACVTGQASDGVACNDGKGTCAGGSCLPNACNPPCANTDMDCTELYCPDGETMCASRPWRPDTECLENGESGKCDGAGNCNPCADKPDGAVCKPSPADDSGVCIAETCTDAHPCSTSGVEEALFEGGGPHYFACDQDAEEVYSPTTDGFVATKDVHLIGLGHLTITGRNLRRGVLVQAGVKATLEGIVITQGSAPFGAGIMVYGSLDLIACIVSHSVATSGSLPNGGGIRANAGTTRLFGSRIEHNVAGVAANGDASGHGGGIYVSGATLIVDDSVLEDNEALNEGGGIRLATGSTATILNGSQITLNRCPNGSGGGIRNYRSTLTVDDSTISENTAGNDGGAISIKGNSPTASMTIRRSTLSGNSASDDGGAIYTEATSVSAGGERTIDDSTLSGNRATSVGGAIYVVGGEVAVTNSTFSGNVAPYAGAIRVNGSNGNVSLTHCTLANNEDGGRKTINNENNGTVTFEATIMQGRCAELAVSKGKNVESTSNTCGFTRGKGDTFDEPDQVGGVNELGIHYGGPTKTYVPIAGRVAIEHYGAPCVLGSDQTTTDEDSDVRPVGINCDAGSVEVR